MTRFWISIALLVGLVLPGALTAEDPQARLVFNGRTEVGEVWANIGMTRNRIEESYLPMVVAVVNHSREPVIIDRDSFRLVGRDGRRYPMPTLQELRKGYGKFALDARAVSGAGIPWEVWSRERKLIESNFFPNIASDRRALTIDELTLPTGYATIDLLYFAKPRGFDPGEPFILEVLALGWEAPLRLGIVIN